MAGEAKRDYPASMGWHVPWWPEYRAVEDHFARVAVAMQTGKPICRVAMLHTIESYWVTEGPADANSDDQTLINDGFADTLNGMLEGQIDADLVAESLLPLHEQQDDSGRLRVGQMAYEVLVIPPALTLRSTTMDRLDKFVQHGGTVIVLGDLPKLVDGAPSDRIAQEAKRWMRCPATIPALLSALAPWRDVELIRHGRRVTGPIYQLRQEEDGSKILFLCSTANYAPGQSRTTLRLRGRHHIEAINTSTGESTQPGERWTDDGQTLLDFDLYENDHILLRLHAAEQPTTPIQPIQWREHERLSDPVEITMHEPNVLLLDRAAWSVDGGEWQAEDEVLRVDNHVRHAIGLGDRDGRHCPALDTNPHRPDPRSGATVCDSL
jgi:hypothetical protein